MKNSFIILFYLGFSSLLIGQEALEINKLKKELQQELVDTSKATIHIKIANLYLKTKPDSSLVNLMKALELAKKSAHQPKIAQVYNRFGYYYEKIDNPKDAIKNYNDAFLIYEKLGDKKEMAKIHNSLGINYSELYSEDRAIENYLKSLNLNKEISNDSGIASNYTNIGNLYYEEENYELAAESLVDLGI